MRRARIKAVANIGVRRKVDDAKTTRPDDKEEEKKEAPVEDATPEPVESVVETKSDENPAGRAIPRRIRAVAKIPIRRNKPSIENDPPKADEADQSAVHADESAFVKPDDSEPPRPSPVTSPAVRQRIRSTPRLDTGGAHHRRNSVSASESEDEHSRRVHQVRHRHDSVTSAVHSEVGVGEDDVHQVQEPIQVVDEQISKNILSPSKTNVSNKELNVDPVTAVGGALAQQPPVKRKVRRSDIAKKMAEAKRDFYNKFGSKTPDRQKLTMMDLIFYNPTANPMLKKCSPTSTKEHRGSFESLDDTSNQSGSMRDEQTVDEPSGTAADELEEEEGMQPVPQVKIGENGEIILDEQSVVIETTDQQIQRMNKSRELTETAINYDDLNTTYGIYKRAKRTKDWSVHETKQFYRVLQMIGTDFSMMLSYFKNRTRRDLKLKFKKEEKINRHLIDKVLLNPCTFDLNELQRALDKDMEKIRAEEMAKQRLLELKQTEAQKRKRKVGEKRVRNKTGSWFARQMYADKSEMMQAFDEDDPAAPGAAAVNEDSCTTTSSTSSSPAVAAEEPAEHAEPAAKRCKFIIDEFCNDLSLSRAGGGNIKVRSEDGGEESSSMLVMDPALPDATTGHNQTSNNNNNNEKLNCLLKDYLGHNDSVILDLRVVLNNADETLNDPDRASDPS